LLRKNSNGFGGVILSVQVNTSSWLRLNYIVLSTGSGSTPVNPGNTNTITITGLASAATYYFRIWTCDMNNNWSGISMPGTTSWILYEIGIDVLDESSTYYFEDTGTGDSVIFSSRGIIPQTSTSAKPVPSGSLTALQGRETKALTCRLLPERTRPF